MASIPLNPYPRMAAGDVDWSGPSVELNGTAVEHDRLPDRWDADSLIRVSVGAAVNADLLRNPDFAGAHLVVRAVCRDTAVTRSVRAEFRGSAGTCYANGTVEFSGAELAQTLEVRGVLQAPCGDEGWLSRRIIAEYGPTRIGLDSSLAGFPTSALSFSENHLPATPWRISVTAVSLSDPFANSVKLLLNVDYPLVNELIDGRAQPYVENALQASIIRVLLHSVRRLTDADPRRDAVEKAVEEFPESIAAAADKTCRDELRRPLVAVLSLLRSHPEEVEDLIAEAVGYLRGKR